MSSTLSAGAIVRPLDPSEAEAAAIGAYVGYSLRVRGNLDPTALAAAFAALTRTYPILSCRVADDPDGRAVFIRTDDPPPPIWAARADEPLPEPGGRVALVHIAGEDTDTAWVTLLAHHSAVDGHHALRLLVELWTYYTDIAEGRAVLPRRRYYPRSLEQVLGERDITVERAVRTELPPVVSVPPESAPGLGIDPGFRLSVEQTTALVQLARRVGVSVNGLVSAALMQAVAEVEDLDITQVRYGYAVDLRTRLDPPVGDTEGTNILGAATFTATPETATDAETLARAVTEQLTRDLDTGEIQKYFLRHPDQFVVSTFTRLPWPGAVTMTNWGIIPPMPTPDGITIDGFRRHRFLTKPRREIAIGRLYPRYSCVLYTFQGQLAVDIVGSNPRGPQLSDRIHANLVHLLTPESTAQLPDQS